MNELRHNLPRDVDRVWLITGASSGFGRALSEAVLERGERAVVTARNPEPLVDFIERYPAQTLLLELDVTRPDQIGDVLAQAMDHFGRIDVLVNNAGYGLVGAVEELDFTQLRRLFETNFFGLVSMTRAALPIMRRARRGHIINLSSVAGIRARPGVGGYSASKFAVEGLSEALAQEVAPLGIKVTIVEPGDGDPKKAARAIIEVVDSEHPPLRLALGADSVSRIRQQLASMADELSAWESVSLSTAFDLPNPPAARTQQTIGAALPA